MQKNHTPYVLPWTKRLAQRIAGLASRKPLRWGALATVPLVVAASFMATGATVIKSVDLSTEPLYAAVTSDKPTLALALSIEYPTVGTQYWDADYKNTIEYIGYYDADACYTYNNSPTETAASPLTKEDYKRFDRKGTATNRMCTDSTVSETFSGNFLNWASSSAIDMLRLALSGGDRYIDTTDITILQRAVLPDGGDSPSCFWNNGFYFPAKKLPRNSPAGTGKFWGAVPKKMIDAAGNNDIHVANILDRIYFRAGVANSNECSAANRDEYLLAGSKEKQSEIASEDYLFSRVSVCTSNAKGELEDVRKEFDLCQRYPNGKYKPVGVIQKYSEQMRLAAFGYIMDQTASYSGGPFGGVLRAPMKYVGAKTYNTAGVEDATTNPSAEWDGNTGIFKINPDGHSMGVSGVVNYLNKFGRTGTKGKYKHYDAVSELYYETLRYLQGLDPSPLAIDKVSTATSDGFPVYTNWIGKNGVGDPYGGRSNTADYSCQKNNIVVIGDVNTNESNRYPEADETANIPDISYWTGIVSAFESDNPTKYLDGDGIERKTTTPNTKNTFDMKGNARYPIVGLSYWAHTHDIRGKSWKEKASQRPGLRTKTFLFDVNENSTESNNDKRRYQNQFFTSAKYGGFESNPSNKGGNPYNTFGNPFLKENGAKAATADNNVWQKEDQPGEASTYYLQSDARGVLNAFNEIFDRASISARSIAGSAVQSKNLREQTSNAIYQGTFNTADWSGDLLSIPVSVSDDNKNTVTIGNDASWTAATELGKLTDPNSSRKIFMGRAGAIASPTATAFAWSAIDEGLQIHLSKATPKSTADSLGQERLNYLRGKRSLEGTTFRLRNKLLGDIVNSGVVYSGKPATTIRSSSYSEFVKTINALNSGAGRTPAVFVGANDGMLHAFEATTGKSTSGKELFAYIPSWMGPKLSALADKNYVNNHQSYVDGPPAVAEAMVSQKPDEVWKTVLVSGTGAGGKGVFALDVTNPSSFDASKVMWEFTQMDDPDMGYVVGRPQILKLRTSAPKATPEYRWFAVVASGVNNNKDDGSGKFSTSGAPALFLLALDKTAGSAWTATGSTPNYYKIVFPVDSVLTADLAPGMANFSAALGTVGEVAQIYAGDLHGNLWKLDFDLYGASDWIIGKLSPFIKDTAAYPLYIAKDKESPPNRQPITMAPSLIRGDAKSSTYIAFGTGKYLESSDNKNEKTQSFYAVFDNEDTKFDDGDKLSIINGRDRLMEGKVDAKKTNTITVPYFQWGRPSKANLSSTSERAGWYFDFPNTGERQVSNAKSVGDFLVFGSLIPGASGSTNTCTASGGGGVEYTANIDNGTTTFKLSSVNIMGEPMVMELDGATEYTPADNTGRRKKTVVHQTIQQGSTGLDATTKVSTTFVAGRLSWRQINNYQDIKKQASP